MNAPLPCAGRDVSGNGVVELLVAVRSKGVRLWSEGGQLRYRAPKGALSQVDVAELQAAKSAIVALLDGAERLDCAPLTFSQLAYWHMYPRGMRVIASATRLLGRLDVDALQESLTCLLQRHAALRTRIVVVGGEPMQEVHATSDCALTLSDLSHLDVERREHELAQKIEQIILDPIDVAVGPLVAVHVTRLRADEHVLIVAIEHLIADMFSMSIVLRDLFAGYMQVVTSGAIALPTIPVQYSDYAIWQRKAHALWLAEHGPYWERRLAGCQRMRFPESSDPATAVRCGWGAVQVRISPELRSELQDWARLQQTTLVMAVFTAYAALVLRWCDSADGIVQYQSDGRINPEIEQTVGFFASILLLRVELRDDDTFLDFMARARAEYCQAHEHADLSSIAARLPTPEFTFNPVFNWVPQPPPLEQAGPTRAEHALLCSAVQFVHPMLKNLELDHEPGILLHDTGDEVVGYLYFPSSRICDESMTQFAHNLLRFLAALLREPTGCVRHVPLLR